MDRVLTRVETTIVAANGDNLVVYTGGEFGLSGGTSQSTPIFAAIVSRLSMGIVLSMCPLSRES